MTFTPDGGTARRRLGEASDVEEFGTLTVLGRDADTRRRRLAVGVQWGAIARSSSKPRHARTSRSRSIRARSRVR
ncbi:hypothetical protein RI054_09g46630 [Pseudoscourfieldia marina]